MRRSMDRARRNRKAKLVWTQPGTVWAMDHTEIDDVGRTGTALVVRDLASHRTLFAEVQLSTETAWVTAVLEALFEAHDAPLVIKSDNGSAFVSEEMQRFLEEHRVLHLRSPVRRPSYNGACEAGMRMLKEAAIDSAVLEGGWAGEHLPASARILNRMERRKLGASPDAVWEGRRRLMGEDRALLRERVDRARQGVIDAEGIADPSQLGHARSASLERGALRDALCELNYLTIRRP